jgi:hypothetical protein
MQPEIVTAEMQTRSFKPTGQAKPGITGGLKCKGEGLAYEEAAGRYLRQGWN